MTSGERFLIGIVGQTIYTRYGASYSDSPLDLPDRALDMSKVNSITMTYTAGDTATKVSAFGTVLGGNTDATETKTFNPNNGIIRVSAGRYYNSSYCYFTISSFTTTDGKVHTADNLNY